MTWWKAITLVWELKKIEKVAAKMEAELLARKRPA